MSNRHTVINGIPVPCPEIMYISEADEDRLDTMQAAYTAEYDLWAWRIRDRKRGSRYELVRSNPSWAPSPSRVEIVTFTKRECSNASDIEGWLETYRGRAAMQAAIRRYRL